SEKIWVVRPGSGVVWCAVGGWCKVWARLARGGEWGRGTMGLSRAKRYGFIGQKDAMHGRRVVTLNQRITMLDQKEMMVGRMVTRQLALHNTKFGSNNTHRYSLLVHNFPFPKSPLNRERERSNRENVEAEWSIQLGVYSGGPARLFGKTCIDVGLGPKKVYDCMVHGQGLWTLSVVVCLVEAKGLIVCNSEWLRHPTDGKNSPRMSLVSEPCITDLDHEAMC
ncbi:LOW QUALITY PROTEIN: hypothetical protein HID58_067052, partial [Brassica napus]